MVRVSGEVLEGVRGEELAEEDWRKGFCFGRNTTPPNEPRIFFVTLPLPTDILETRMNFIYSQTQF